jgi:Cu/Ag efflux pump CusA
MATVVIGGVVTSTVLSLVVIPVVYTYIDDFETFVLRRFRKQEKALRELT